MLGHKGMMFFSGGGEGGGHSRDGKIKYQGISLGIKKTLLANQKELL